MFNSSLDPKTFKREYLLSMIKVSLVRLLFIVAVWTIFFMLYSLSDIGEPAFKSVILSLIGLYALLELLVIAIRFRSEDKNSELSILIQSLKKNPSNRKVNSALMSKSESTDKQELDTVNGKTKQLNCL